MENFYVTFLALTQIQETLICAGDDGYLYQWKGDQLQQRLFGHEGSIFAMHQSDQNARDQFVTGALDASIVLWHL